MFKRKPKPMLAIGRQGSASRAFVGSFSDPFRNIDWILLGSVIALGVIGMFNTYSATRQRLINQGFDPYIYVQRQVAFAIIATGVMVAIMAVGHDWFRARTVFLYGAVLVSLVLVLVAGAVRGGARLSFDFGIFSVQPAEAAKPIVLLTIAAYLADSIEDRINYHQFVMSLYILGVPIGLILLQPDLGSASVLIAAVVGLLFVAGAKRRYLLLITAMSILTVIGTVIGGVVGGYQLARIEAWLNQNSKDSALDRILLQVRFAKRAVSTGGFFGKGYLNGPLTNGAFIPVQFTDFPFSAIAEQFGMLGGGIVLGLFGIVLWRTWRIAQLARDRLGLLISAGIFTMLSWQIFQNIGMTLGLTPVSGLPLPFISYGGSHLVSSAMLIGLVQSIHMRRLE
ncbi:MAG: FtsW/RodA/SpoVE family cell cycle protein [Ilumatobacteraceae bacterium]